MNRRENKITWASLVIGLGLGLWLGSWIALWKPLALFVVSYPVILIGILLLASLTIKKEA